MTEHNTQQQTQNLNVAADEISIYQGGKLTTVDIEELLDNEVAVRQLVNDLNLAKRDNERSKRIIEQLRLERAGYALQPAILAFVAAVNILGVVLVGVGTNYVTSSAPPPAAWVILIVGAFISLLTAIAPVVLPLLIDFYSKRKRDAN
jgi:hypothetical protein